MVDNIKVSGVSGSEYMFEVYPLWTEFKSLSGIYMFLKQKALHPYTCVYSDKNIYDIMYIGETDDFNRRIYTNLSQHHKYNFIISKGITNIGVMALGCNEIKRKWVESDLIHHHIPQGNVLI